MRLPSLLHRLRVLLPTAVAGAAVLLVPSSAFAVPTITELTPATVQAGSSVVATGTVAPVAAGELVQLEQQLDGAWTKVGQLASTDAGGAWRVTFNPQVGGQVRATQLSTTGGSSAELAVQVAPKVLSAKLARGTIYPFLNARATWRVAPATYPDGRVTIDLSIDRRAAGTVQATIRHGIVTATIPTKGVGRFNAKLNLPARGGFAETSAATPLSFVVRGARVGSGSSRAWNTSLRAALRFRGVHVPGGSSFDSRMGESVIAFHKAYGRARTTTFEASDWKRLTRSAIAVRDRSAGLHIEIDKGRQILMQVRNGKPVMVVHVSSGATGNTPAGRWKVQWKGDWVPSLYGSLLYKSMAITGAYAIHGYPSVPTSPASHGCVRVPMWIAATLYRRSPVGTPIFIYEGPGTTRPSLGRGHRADVPELAGIDARRWADEAL
ncbi:MAG: ErfK/YbiS/YcfS/YnhG family protein [Thermoleophilia bacterium]|nr:ErfK/YbiS/YcfS/YnhG family protein [Thermoleophilia bacterium]